MSVDPFLTHGITLAFVWFLGVNALACVSVAIAAPILARLRVESPVFWLAARLFPAVAATSFVALLFVPSYWKYEPRDFVEGFDATLTVAAAAAVALIAAGVMRGLAAWRSAARRSNDWMRYARQDRLTNASLPAFIVDASQPMMALVGVLRPRLLVTRGLVDALTSAELAASVAHEIGHHRALDNLKRLLMRSAPDFLSWSGTARALERRWAAAAERAADRIAAGSDAHERCTLASALVKVARLRPICVPSAEPISMLVAGGDITSRVHTLLGDAPPPRPNRMPALGWIMGGITLVPLAASYSPLLHAVHEATEVLVRSTGALW